MNSNESIDSKILALPGWITVLPSLLTILIAILFKQVLVALFSGIFLGSMFIYDFNPLTGFIRAVDTIIINALAD